MKLFGNNQSSDSIEVGQAIKDRSEGKRGVELVMKDGELVAVPEEQADQVDGVRAGTIAGKPYWFNS